MSNAPLRSGTALPDGARHAWSSRVSTALLLVALAGYLVVLVWAFPIDMDELLPYHPIACSSASQALNIYTAPCGGYPTSLGPLEFQRAFEYIGATPALILAPVLATTHWAGWHLLAGVVVLVVTAVGIVASIRIPRRYALVVIAWVPIALATIHDTGPIRYAMLAIAWTPALVRYFCTASRGWARYGSLAIVLLGWVVATESKPFFLYLVPGTIVWTGAAFVLTDAGFLRRHLVRVALALGLASVSALLVTLVLTVEGQTYLAYLASFGSPNSLLMSAGIGGVFLFVWTMTAQRFILQIPNVDALFPDLLQGPANALPLSADRGAPLSVLLLVLSTLAVLVLVGWSWWRLFARGTSQDRKRALWLTAAALTLFVGAVMSRGGSVHHFVFTQVPIVVLVITALRERGWSPLRTSWLALGVSALAVASMLAIPLKPEVSRDIDVVMSEAIKQSAPGSVVNCQPWGCYYQFALADRDGVPIVWAERPDQQAELAASMPPGASIWHVCRECTVDNVATGFPTASIRDVIDTDSGWRLFEVTP